MYWKILFINKLRFFKHNVQTHAKREKYITDNTITVYALKIVAPKFRRKCLQKVLSKTGIFPGTL